MKQTLEEYRKGATGSLMDEYERAAEELKALLRNVDGEDYMRLADTETTDEDCRSIETIMNHVVRAGFGYANYIREAYGLNSTPYQPRRIPQADITDEIDNFLAYTNEIFEGRWGIDEDERLGVLIKTRWEVVYNVDQLLEHAIVHLLRHRRQIEKFLFKLR